MKKYLIVFAALACVFAGCKKDEATAVTGIAINPNKIEKFYIGDTVRLGLVISPAEAKLADGEKVVWTSSDAEIVNVVSQNGTITADNPGDAVVKVTAGGFNSACQIHANYEPLFWNVGQIFYFPSTKSDTALTDSVFNIEGTKCKLYSVTFVMPNANDFNEDYSAGEGYCLFADLAAPFPIEGTAEQQESIAGSTRELKLVETEDEWKITPFSSLVGELDPEVAGPIYQAYLEKIDAGDQSAKPDWDTFKKQAMRGAHITTAEFSESGVSWSYIPSALMKEGYVKIVREKDGAYLDYDVTLQWIVSGFWGLAADWEAEELSELLIKPYELCPSAWVHYDTNNEEGEFIEEEEEEEEGGDEASAPKKSVRRGSTLVKRNFLPNPVPFFVNEKVAK